MKYLKFFIKKYKAIKEVEIDLKTEIIPIIGINESGKTSILQAILAFDKYNDNYFNGMHLQAKNRYDYESSEHVVSAEILLDDFNDIKNLTSINGLSKNTKLYKDLASSNVNSTPIIVSRNLDTLMYKFENLDVPIDLTQEIIDHFLKNSPFILFFDDFTDRVPDKIIYPSNYLTDEYIAIEDLNRTEWNVFIEEIFKRATDKKYTLREFLKTEKKYEREGILSDVSDKLNEDIIKDWEKLKILKIELKNELQGLKISLDYEKDGIENHIFSFRVIDKNYEGKGRHFHIHERSKGFQWFFNFAIKLKYNIKYKKDYKGAIYLLDEPGSYLHSSAQEELLKSLKEISSTNKVIYCTHSQYLLNPDLININNIKIAHREKGSITLINFNRYPSNFSKGALSPLYDSLHLNINKHLILKNEIIIITEGITDFYFWKMIHKYLKLFQNEFTVIPGAGAGNLKELISFSIAWSKSYCVLFDSDGGGRKEFNRYEKFYGASESRNWLKYFIKSQKNDVTLENLLSDSDQKNIMRITESIEVKQAIISLYFSDELKKKNFFEKLNSTSLNRISSITLDIEKRLSSNN